jgi:hypothetical protein
MSNYDIFDIGSCFNIPQQNQILTEARAAFYSSLNYISEKL